MSTGDRVDHLEHSTLNCPTALLYPWFFYLVAPLLIQYSFAIE